MSNIKYYKDALKIWKNMANVPKTTAHLTDVDIVNKINSIFHIGPSYYYIFDVLKGQFVLVDKGIYDILGMDHKTITVAQFMGSIHPEDLNYFLNFELKVSEFFQSLRQDQIMKYKVSYDYRVKNADGVYVRIHQQIITINISLEGSILQTLGIHTDISHIKESGNPVLSFIGLEGEPSFINVDYKKAFVYKSADFSAREMEVIKLLCEGFNTEAIAKQLFISQHTVRTHRKNILTKASVNSSTELVGMAIKNGWI